MSYKIAAIGSEDVVFPFRQAGIDCYAPQTGDALFRQLAQLFKEGYLLLFVSEDVLSDAPNLLQLYDNAPRAAVIPIPGTGGEGSAGSRRIEEMVEKALGQKLL